MQARALMAAVLMLGVSLAGCMGGDGTASVYIRDDPSEDFDAVNVTFTHVYVHEAGGDADEDDGEGQDAGPDDAGDDGAPEDNVALDQANQQQDQQAQDRGQEQFQEQAGWFPIVETTSGIEVDLLNASGTQAAFLGEESLDPGQYTQIAVVIDEAYGIDKDGDRVTLHTPSNVGRLVESFDIEEGTETRIVLDLDLDRALVERNGGWTLTPVWGNTAIEKVDSSESGSDVHEPGDVTEME